MILNAKQIAEYTGATVVVEAIDPSHLATSITWDSREVKRDGVYVALPGKTVDGHNFIEAALHAGACVVLVMQPIETRARVLATELGAAVLEVVSTQAALADLARRWREHLPARVIALTGSTGKTTTKNLVRDVLSKAGSTVATRGNQNNELGVPRTILEADMSTAYLVVEMGMRGLGQIADLCAIAKPDIALITNVGQCHIELLGTQENIARAKAEALCALPDRTGVAVLNRADEYSAFMADCAQLTQRNITVLDFDGSGTTDVTQASLPAVFATDIQLDDEGYPHFQLNMDGQACSCSLHVRGMHNVANAAAAAAVGKACGLGIGTIVEGLEESLPEAGRQEVHITSEGVCVIDDTYNANPDSMRASLALFAVMKVEGKRIAVLGDMGELGKHAQACHEGIGRFAAECHFDHLICVGTLARAIAQGALQAGFAAHHITQVDSCGEALGLLESELQSGDAVLVKASRAMELDRIVRGLLN